MFFIHLKIAWRNLVRNKVYSAINIGGLSIGIAISLLISLYVIHEYSYDSFHKNADRIYGMYLRVKLAGVGDSTNYPLTSYRSGPALMQADPSVESFIRIKANFDKDPIIQSVSSPEKKFTDNFLFADSNFFSFYSFHLKEGNADQVLSRPFTVVISERMAKKYFGNADPVGHLLKYDNAYTFEITGVAENAPSNSTMRYDFVASLSSSLSMKDGKQISEESNLTMGIFSTKLLLRKGANPANSEILFKKLIDRNKNENDTTSRFGLVPLTATHFFYDGFDNSNIKYLQIFMLAGVLILLLALINYMSLATANATQRAKEIGVRKVIGANRSTIARQFYVESALYVTIAFILGFLLFTLAQASFFNRIQLPIDTSFLYKSRVMLAFGGLFVISVFVAGSYPSIVLSSFSPITVLYGKLSRERGGVNVRRFFIVLQFSISVGMIISSLVIERQMYFFRHTDTGINRENVVMINFGNGIGAHYRSFKNEVSQLAGVSEVATAQYPLYRGWAAFSITTRDIKTPQQLVALTVDDHFMSVLHMHWLIPPTGQSIFVNDKHIIINQAAIGKLNLPPNPIGEVIHLGNDNLFIEGVVKNFNYTSLHTKIDALALFIEKDSAITWGVNLNGCLFAKIAPHVNIPSLMETIQRIYAKYDPQTAFNFEFLDDVFNAGYKAEDRLASIFTIFTGLMIVIACLGLFALVAYSVAQRTREIGIRKILGASIQGIITLLAKDFILYIIIAVLIAIPVTLIAMNRWLNNFAYRISLGWGIFTLAGALTIALALLTISGIAIRAAKANPVKNLRTE